MMKTLILLLTLSMPLSSMGQMITSSQNKALNNYVEFANGSADEIQSVVRSVMEFYPRMLQAKSGRTTYGGRYACPVQLEDYYYNKALEDSKALPANISSKLNGVLKELRTSSENIDRKCKALDTYYKLEDYKTDNYAGAQQLCADLPALLSQYRKNQTQLQNAVSEAFKSFQHPATTRDYVAAADLMLTTIKQERELLDRWDYNLLAEVPTGWIVEEMETSIAGTLALKQKLESSNLNIKYPASSQFKAFIENVGSILEMKRSAWDGYNAEAKKSDAHANRAYEDIINYFNGTLISFYNSFLKYAANDGYLGLEATKYAPSFSIRSESVKQDVKVVPYKEVTFTPFNLPAQTKPIPSNVAATLNAYVDYVNECIRQSALMLSHLHSFSSSARYYRGLTDFSGRGGLKYSMPDIKIPASLYQQLELNTKALNPGIASALLAQAATLMNILKEMEQQSQWLEIETAEKRYERDQLQGVYRSLERYEELFEAVDVKKELFYHDVRQVYDSYPVVKPEPNWILSWSALRKLVDDDHGAMVQAKSFYKGATTSIPETSSIDKQLRDVLSNEYDNMKGIEKYGRSNGLCPYTPYEDIPETSRRLSEKLKKTAELSIGSQRHPYDDMVYLYNEIIDDYNKFCTLSKLELLKDVKQLRHVELNTTDNPRPVKPAVHNAPTKTPPVKPSSTVSSSSGPSTLRDTVYIERHDTVYLDRESLSSRSMDGYATNNLVLLLDVSGSMNAPGKLPLLKEAVLGVLDMMRQEDQVSIVVYSGKAKVLLQPTSFKEEDKVREAINSLSSSGKTDGNAGIKLAYQVADKNYIRGGNNRIILATDGEFPIGESSFDLVKSFASQDIFISVFNFGNANASAKNLHRLTDSGKGNYQLITRDNMEINLIREAKAKRAR